MSEDTKALVDRLFAAHRNSILAFFSRRVRQRSDAADLSQEVYVRMLRQLRNVNSIHDPEAYLFTVASNLAKEHAVRTRRFGMTTGIEDPSVQSQLAALPTLDDNLDAEQRVRRLREILPQLPAKAYAAVVLQYDHGFTYEQIAEQLGVSRNMVKKYLGQALAHCRRRMTRLG